MNREQGPDTSVSAFAERTVEADPGLASAIAKLGMTASDLVREVLDAVTARMLQEDLDVRPDIVVS